jgi:electron transport complex protein RnfD
MEERYLVAASPHLRDVDDIPRIMWSVVIALLPATAMGIYFFSLRAVMLIVFSIAAAVASEAACLAMRKKPLSSVLDGSVVVTGLLLALLLPASTSWYCAVVGSAFAIAIAKHCFGGLGHNIWNPALAGRVFLQFAYPTEISLSEWPAPRLLFNNAASAADGLTKATPLFKEAPIRSGHLDLFLGNGIGGSLGETCKLALLVGGLFLIISNRIDWRVPLVYIGTVFVLSIFLPAKGTNPPPWTHDPVYQVLSGGLFIGAFFMATDMVTTPVTSMGRSIFAAGCGLLVVLIRFYGGYPEGVAYSILLMNTTTPIIDRYCRPRVYGSRTPKPAPRTTV